jgi:hypothetical protein
MGRNKIAAALLGTALCLAGRASAQPIPAGRLAEWGVALGYGAHFHVGPGTTDFGVAVLTPSVGFRLSSRLEFVASATFEHYVSPSAYFVGVVPVGARLYIGNEKFYPYLGLGLGAGWTDLDDKVLEISRRFNFRIEGSFGVKFPSGETSAWTIEARYQHTSNAGTVHPNQGLNAIVGMVGLRFR